MFADDIAIMAETEEDLQCMLSTLHTWCESWRLHINTSKTKTVHFRHKSQLRTSFNFKCGPSELEVVPSYKYLGVWLDDNDIKLIQTPLEPMSAHCTLLQALSLCW